MADDQLPRCAWCSEPFLRLVPHQNFCCRSHQMAAYERSPQRRAADVLRRGRLRANPEAVEKRRQCRRKSADKHREGEKERHRTRRLTHPEQARVYKHRRRARKKGAGGRFTAADIERIRRAQRDRCAYCKVALKGAGERDHIVPLTKGGTNDPSNIQLLCKPCNASKNAADPLDFARRRGLLL